jgi:hypothetical protein
MNPSLAGWADWAFGFAGSARQSLNSEPAPTHSWGLGERESILCRPEALKRDQWSETSLLDLRAESIECSVSLAFACTLHM